MNIIDLNGRECVQLLRMEEEIGIVDVRSLEEFSISRIPGAFHCDVLKPYAIDAFDKLDKSRPYLIYCSIGVRSRSTLKIIGDMGFWKIYHLTNGLVDYSGNLDYSPILVPD